MFTLRHLPEIPVRAADVVATGWQGGRLCVHFKGIVCCWWYWTVQRFRWLWRTFWKISGLGTLLLLLLNAQNHGYIFSGIFLFSRYRYIFFIKRIFFQVFPVIIPSTITRIYYLLPCPQWGKKVVVQQLNQPKDFREYGKIYHEASGCLFRCEFIQRCEFYSQFYWRSWCGLSFSNIYFKFSNYFANYVHTNIYEKSS